MSGKAARTEVHSAFLGDCGSAWQRSPGSRRLHATRCHRWPRHGITFVRERATPHPPSLATTQPPPPTMWEDTYYNYRCCLFVCLFGFFFCLSYLTLPYLTLLHSISSQRTVAPRSSSQHSTSYFPQRAKRFYRILFYSVQKAGATVGCAARDAMCRTDGGG